MSYATVPPQRGFQVPVLNTVTVMNTLRILMIASNIIIGVIGTIDGKKKRFAILCISIDNAFSNILFIFLCILM
jgi:hypothetical protein